MSKIVAAIDNSPAARPVLTVALHLAGVLGAEVEGLHVTEDGTESARGIADSLGVPCLIIDGEPLGEILRSADAADVVAVVVGARRGLRRARAGHLARQLADRVNKPVLVVPPEYQPGGRLHKVLIAMEGIPAKARSVQSAITLAADAELDIVVVHVDDDDSIPSFSDEVAHETAAYADEFLARYVPAAPRARLELRVGAPADEILALADGEKFDLLAIGWPRAASNGKNRGEVASAVLDRSHIPVLLVATS